jgi:hypothetical protein
MRCPETPFRLVVSMQTAVILEHHMSLRIFDTQLGVQGMEDICELGYCLVSFLQQYVPFFVEVVKTSNRVVLFLNNIPERILGDCDCK